MTKIKLCGLTRPRDIETADRLMPEYIGFVFFKKSRRYISPSKAAELKKLLNPDISAVGVFVNENADTVARLLRNGTIDIAQLHGDEDEAYIRQLRAYTDKPIIKAFKIRTERDAAAAQNSTADYVLLDSGAGTGTVFDWQIIQHISRRYFLAGGIDAGNVRTAVDKLNPYAVDVSSGIETDGLKDENKMKEFVLAVRSVRGKEEKL